MAKSTKSALADGIEKDAIKRIQIRVDRNSFLMDEIVNRLVAQYCEQLDEYMLRIKAMLDDENNPPTTLELDACALNLPVLLYFTGEAQEALGIREDVAKAIKMEVYNEVYNRTGGTIGDKTAQADLATQDEFIAHSAYQRAYKKIKLRMELANETLQSIKKVMSRRMQEYEMSKVDDGRLRNG